MVDRIIVPDYSLSYPCERIIYPCPKSLASDLNGLCDLLWPMEHHLSIPAEALSTITWFHHCSFPGPQPSMAQIRGCSYSLGPEMKMTWKESCKCQVRSKPFCCKHWDLKCCLLPQWNLVKANWYTLFSISAAPSHHNGHYRAMPEELYGWEHFPDM